MNKLLGVGRITEASRCLCVSVDCKAKGCESYCSVGSVGVF